MAKIRWAPKRKRLAIVLGSLLVLIIAFRIALPYILLRVVNKQLTKIDGYRGHVNDIDVALIRGAYTIKGMELVKTGGKIPVPFFSSPVIDLSIEWQALFDGALVGEIIVRRPKLNFVKGPTKTTTQTDIDNDWIEVVDNLMPLKLNRLEITDGEIHYRDFHSSPKVNIYAKNVDVLAENLSNSKDKKEELPSSAKATADVYGGKARLNMKLDPLNRQTEFDANAELKNLDLTRLNDFLKAYGKFDVSKGTLGLYAEAATKNNRIAGYVKPIMKDLEVLDWQQDKKDNPVRIAWEAVVGGLAWVFKNHPKDQVATRASFTGNLDNPDISIWSIIGQVLRNAFIQALYPSLEDAVNLQTIELKKDESKTFLGKAFDKITGDNKDKDKKKKEEEKKEEEKKKEEKKKDK
jgi:hypothetical protein